MQSYFWYSWRCFKVSYKGLDKLTCENLSPIRVCRLKDICWDILRLLHCSHFTSALRVWEHHIISILNSRSNMQLQLFPSRELTYFCILTYINTFLEFSLAQLPKRATQNVGIIWGKSLQKFSNDKDVQQVAVKYLKWFQLQSLPLEFQTWRVAWCLFGTFGALVWVCGRYSKWIT